MMELVDRLRDDLGATALVLLRRSPQGWLVLQTSGAAGLLSEHLPAAVGDAPASARVSFEDPLVGTVLRAAGLAGMVQVPVWAGQHLWGVLCVATERPSGEPDLVHAQRAVAEVADLLVLAERLRASERRADTDPLTGLANRRAFDDRAAAAFRDYLAGGPAVGVIMCDVNGLKAVNDRAGHAAGDRLIIAVADILAAVAASAAAALAARLGGDEFGLLVLGASDEQVMALASTCGDLVQGLTDGDGLACGVATTSGVVEPVTSVHKLIRLADAAQYRAKRAGSRAPVLAGRAADATAPDTTVRGPRNPLLRALADGVDQLAACRCASTLERLVRAAQATQPHLNPAGWWISHAPPGGTVLRTVAIDDPRSPSASQERVAQAELSAQFNLALFPRTVRALAGGVFTTELGAIDNDPAEEHVLVTSGFTAMAAAGSTQPDGGWMLEVFLDEVSGPLQGLEVILRALVELAVHPG